MAPDQPLEFNDRTNHAYPISATSDIALEHWRRRILRRVVLNGIDQDYGYVVLGADQHSRFRAIDVVCSSPSIGEARMAAALDDAGDPEDRRDRVSPRLFAVSAWRSSFAPIKPETLSG